MSGDLGHDSEPVESGRTLSAETIGLEIGPKRDGILGGRALNFAWDIGHLSLCAEENSGRRDLLLSISLIQRTTQSRCWRMEVCLGKF